MNEYYRKKLNLGDRYVQIEDKALFQVGAYVAPLRVNQSDRGLLAKTFKEMRNDGTIRKILAKYMGETPAAKVEQDYLLK